MLRMLFTPPNSSEGLIIRAEMLEEDAEKLEDVELAEKKLLYAEVLRQLASKKLTSRENKRFIKENMRP